MLKKEHEVIADYYGYEPQSRQLIEEMGELIVALNKYWRCKGKIESINGTPVSQFFYTEELEEKANVIEEIADVEVMLAQIKYLLFCEERVEEVKQQKIRRQLQRMKGGGSDEKSAMLA